MNSPRVAYVLRAFPRWSETFILNEVLAQRALGTEVRVFALERVRDPWMQPEAARLLPEVTFVASAEPRRWNGPAAVPRNQRRWSLAGRAIAAELVAWGATHVHAHFAGPAAVAACFAAQAAGIPFSFTAHAKDIFVASLDWQWLRWLGERAHAVVAVCDYNRRFLRRRMPTARVVRIYNGVDLERWAPRMRHARAPSQRVVTAGRFVRKKGFHVLVESLAILRDRGRPLRAVLIGEGREREAIQARTRELKLGRVVRFPGALAQHQVSRHLAHASVVVLPCVVDADGNQDALPTVLLEASACGVPCIATRIAGVPEIVRDGITGRVVAPGDPVALADAIEQLTSSTRLRARMGVAARQHAEARFDEQRSSRALQRLFMESLRLPRARSADRPVARNGEGLRAHRVAVC